MLCRPVVSAAGLRPSLARPASAEAIQASMAAQSSLFTSARGASRPAPSASSRASSALPHAQKCVYDLPESHA